MYVTALLAIAVPLAVLPPTASQPERVTFVRGVQTVNGVTQTATDVAIERRGANLFRIRRSHGEAIAVTLRADGILAVTDPRGMPDAAFADLVNGLNLALAAVRGADATSRAPWTATVSVAVNVVGAPVAFVTHDANGGAFAFVGDGRTEASAPADDPTTIAIHIDGRAANGCVQRIAVTQTRAIRAGRLPFVNVASWSFTFS